MTLYLLNLLYHILWEIRIDPKKIYSKLDNKELRTKLVERLYKSTNTNYHCHYIRVLGIAGDKRIIPIIKKYIDTNNIKVETKEGVMFSCSIKSIGAIGDESVVPFLENRLGKYDETLFNNMAAYSLYLLTGERFEYTSSYGIRDKYNPVERNLKAHILIKELKGKKRTHRDMIKLDRLIYPTREEYENSKLIKN